jgi:hypothetical protein
MGVDILVYELIGNDKYVRSAIPAVADFAAVG